MIKTNSDKPKREIETCLNDSKKADKTEKYFRYQDNYNGVGHTVILNTYILPFLLFGYCWFAFSL